MNIERRVIDAMTRTTSVVAPDKEGVPRIHEIRYVST